MEQITRDEVIELLRANRATVKDYQNGLFDAHVTPGGYVEPGEISRELEGYQKQIEQIDSAISALQAAEPVITVDIRRDPRDGSPNPRILKFADLGDGEHQLFALPCPPATELAPKSWREELETIAEILEADGDEWNCAARIRKILKTSPAEAQVPEGYAGVTVWVGDRPVTQIVNQTELVSSNADELLRRFENARHLLTASPAPDHSGDENKMVGWISVDERLPEPGITVMVYAPPQPGDYADDVRIGFDSICPESDGDYWLDHGEHYEHYSMVAKGGEGWTGPSVQAPYTHWMPLPNPPQQEEAER